MTDYIGLAVPFFLLAIAAELVYARVTGRSLYRLDDTLTSLSCGIYNKAVDVAGWLVGGSLYLLVYDRWHLIEMPAHAWSTWLVTFLLFDLAYYWFHRTSHRVNLVWGSHNPHHQSEEFNYSTALRQGAFEPWFTLPFYLPLAVLGVPPLVMLAVVQLTAIYQFWVHTRTVGKLGWLEQVFITPSHHRVHHGKNRRYIDKNYGAILVLWDKLFGTFAAEEEEVVYGTVHPFVSCSPMQAQAVHWQHVAAQAWRTPSWRDKLRIWFKPPGWDPQHPEAEPEIPDVQAGTYVKPVPAVSRTLRWYALAQFLPAMIGFSAFLQRHGERSPVVILLFLAAVLLSLELVGALLEAKPWALPAESLRLLAVAAAGGLWLPGVPAKGAALVWALASLLWLLQARGAFRQTPRPVDA